MQTFNRIAAASRAIDQQAERIAMRTAYTVQSIAQQLAPVDTGNLRNTISVRRVGRMAWEVVAAAAYALYVELGTRYTRAQPFMAPAARRVLSSLSGAGIAIKLTGMAL